MPVMEGGGTIGGRRLMHVCQPSMRGIMVAGQSPAYWNLLHTRRYTGRLSLRTPEAVEFAMGP
jgi:hypothetical protein